MPHAGVGEVDQATSHTAAGHEGARQQEERNGQQRVVLAGFEQLDRQGTNRVVAEEQDGHGPGQAQGNRHRNADKHQHEQSDK